MSHAPVAGAQVSRRMLMPFAAMSASYFAHIGFFNPYLSLWLKELGYSVGVIGILVSMQAFTRLYSPYAWGWLSDRSGHRVRLLRISAGIALFCSLGLAHQGGLLWLALVDELILVLRGGVPTFVREVQERHARGDFSSDV